ncbi:MAG TPA: sugar ABC transporter permease, partial [Sulfitobacter sp.]|nr:sugar ABC transporter permease [Sulfitobacter sp.]
EAAEMDGASPVKRFGFITLPHLSRAITVVVLIQTIFLLSIFAEIFVTTQGAFGTKTLTYLIFQRVLESQNIGLGSAGGVYAIILANIVAIFLMRMVGKNLDA